MADTDSGTTASGTTTPAASAIPAANVAASTVAAPVTSSVVSTTATGLGYILVVRHAFGDYRPGTEITDTATIKEILAGELACYVIKRAA